MMIVCTIALIITIGLSAVMVRAGLDRIAEPLEELVDASQTGEPEEGEEPGERLHQRLHEVQSARFGKPMAPVRGATGTV